jgi:predicted HD phosphohydrolase
VTEVSTLDDLFGVLDGAAAHDDGEALDLLAHSLQCAQLLAKTAPDDLELQVAGLVHDLGTMLEPARPDTHARTGANAVERLLGARVAALVGGHDHAKRYLVSTDPTYRGRLSEMSVVTLTLQGGEMGEPERIAFEAAEHFDSLVRLRRADDAAKVAGRTVPGLETWRARVQRVADDHTDS